MGVIFLDNAATTPLEPRVKEEMIRMMENFGNPSSTHISGRGAKVEVEVVRKRIAQTIVMPCRVCVALKCMSIYRWMTAR